MADLIFSFAPSIPAGTPIAAPFTLPLTMQPCIVTSIGILVPPGPRGQMGFAIGAAGTAIIPATPGTWMVLDDYADEWPLENYISSGGWEFFGYNLGQYAHAVFLRFMVNLPSAPGSSSQVLNDPSVLDNAVTSS